MRADGVGACQLLLRADPGACREPGAAAALGRAVYAHALLRGAPDDSGVARAGLHGQPQAGATPPANAGTDGVVSQAPHERGRSRTPGVSVSAAGPFDRAGEPSLEYGHHVYPLAGGVRLLGGGDGLV